MLGEDGSREPRDEERKLWRRTLAPNKLRKAGGVSSPSGKMIAGERRVGVD